MTLIAFSGNPLTRLEELRRDEAWLDEARESEASRFLPFFQLMPLMAGASLRWLEASELPDRDAPCVFLGVAGDSPRFAVDLGPEAPFPQTEFEDPRAAVATLPSSEGAIMGHGRSLLDWHARHGFCAVCGARTAMIRGGAARRCTAASCKAEHFPRVDPVVIMLVTRGDFCLMGRQPRFPPGMYSALAGFMEPGETIEEAVRRELREEAGLQVKDVHYSLSQPWPFPSSLMIGCFATAEDDRITPDETELEDLRWFSRAQVAAALGGQSTELIVPPGIAIAHRLLKNWMKRD